MPDGHDIALAGEDVRLAELDAVADQLSGAHDDEQAVAIALHLGPLVRFPRVLDRQRVEAELRLERGQLVADRLVQADPHQVIGLGGPFARGVQRDVRDSLAVLIGARANNPGSLLYSVVYRPIHHAMV